MNRSLFAAALALATCSFAHADEGAAVATLKSECAAKHSVKLEAKNAATNEYHFVYAKGEYRGEARADQELPCTEAQYVAYLETVDPTRVMEASPTAAGKPAAREAEKK